MTVSPEEMAVYLRAAANQRRWLIPRRRDRELAASGGTVIHAVDADVVMLYTSPWANSVCTANHKAGYAEIFPGEERDLTIALGTALAEYIFHTLSANIPLVIIPPMDDEISTVFTTVAHKANNETDIVYAALDEIKLLVSEAKTISDHTLAINQLAKRASTIARFLRGREGATAELRRFTKLLRHTRIVPPEYLISNTLIQDPVICRALEPPTDLVERIEFRILREKWFNLLHESKSARRKTVLIDADAQALARVEWINKKLAPSEPNAKPMYKFVLITGDRAIHKAGSQICYLENSKSSFGELFLRHPKSYLGEQSVLTPIEDVVPGNHSVIQDTQVDQWLDTWLGELHPGSDDFDDALDNLLAMSDQQLSEWVEPLCRTRPQLLEKFKNAWTNHTRKLILDRPPSPLESKLANAREKGVLLEYKSLIAELSQTIDHGIKEAWGNCFNVVAQGGYSLVRARSSVEDLIPSHIVPFLVFNRFGDAGHFASKVLKSYKSGGLSSAKWNKILDELKKEDPSDYAFYVGLAMLFAVDGIWKVSAILANRALVIATRDKPKNITGREAAYLRAVALRYSSRSIEDLTQISELLNKAANSYKQDVSESPGIKASPCRFDAERLSLYVTYHLYRVLLGSTIVDPVPPLEDLKARIEEMLDNLASNKEKNEIKGYVERNLLVDWIMASLLQSKDEGGSINTTQLIHYHERLKQNIEKWSDSLKPSYYVQAILHTCSALITEDAATKRTRVKEAVHWLNDDAVQRHSIMRYDADRFQLLREFVQGYVK